MVTSSKRTYALSTPETLSLWQTTADPYLHRRCSNTVCLSLYRVPGSWCAQGLFEPSERLWQGQGLILNVNHPSYHLTGASPLPLDMGCLLTVAPVCTILLGFFDLGRGVSLHRCFSDAQVPLMTLGMGYLLTSAAPDFGHGVFSLSF